MTGIELTFEIRLSGETVQVTYHQNGRPLANAAGMPSPAARGPLPPVLKVVRKALETGHVRTLDQTLGLKGRVDVGHALFAVLFPQKDRISDIIKAAVGETSPTILAPDARTINARIVTDDALLAGMPWRMTQYLHTRLTGSVVAWTFEVARAVHCPKTITLPTPAKVLVIAPRAGEPALPVDEHLLRLQGRLSALSERYDDAPYWLVARTQAEIVRYGKFGPHIIYYFGHARLHGGMPCAELETGAGGPDSEIGLFPFAELLSLLPTPPDIIYLNGCWSGGAGWHQIGPSLSARVPLVLTHPTTAWAKPAGEQALDWMSAVIGRGTDPIEALRETGEGIAALDFGMHMLSAHTAYQRWVPGDVLSRRDKPVHATLDRLPQRQPTVEEFTRVMERRHRVCALVGHGTAENRPECLQDLLAEHVDKRLGRQWNIRWKTVAAPTLPWTQASLDAAFRIATGVLLQGPTLAECVRVAMQDLRGRRSRILAFKWGDHPLVVGKNALSQDDLTAWHRFHYELSRLPIPDTCRVVSLLTLVTDKADGVRGFVAAYDDEYGADLKARFVALPPLGHVPRHELVDHLRQSTSLPNHQAGKVADLLLTRSKGGVYTQLVPLIEAAEAENWAVLIKACAPAQKTFF